MAQIADQLYSTLKQSIADLHKSYKQSSKLLFIKIITTILIFLKDIDDIYFGIRCGVFSYGKYIIINYNVFKKLLPDDCIFSRAEINQYFQEVNFIKKAKKELLPILMLNQINIVGNLWKNFAVFTNQSTNDKKNSDICYDDIQYSDDESFSRQPEIMLPI